MANRASRPQAALFLDHLPQRRRLRAPIAPVKPLGDEAFNPLDKTHLAESVSDRLLKRPLAQLLPNDYHPPESDLDVAASYCNAGFFAIIKDTRMAPMIKQAWFGICTFLILATAAAAGCNRTPAQWRLKQESVAAVSKESYVEGAHALSGRDAFNSAAVARLFFWGKLLMVPAGTMVARLDADDTGATRVRLLDGGTSGKIVWLYPFSAEKLGFLPERPVAKQ